MSERCYHLICDITRTFGNESNFIQCRECKAEFRENTSDFGIAVGTFGHPEHIMYYGKFKGTALNNIYQENKELTNENKELWKIRINYEKKIEELANEKKQLEQHKAAVDEIKRYIFEELDRGSQIRAELKEILAKLEPKDD